MSRSRGTGFPVAFRCPVARRQQDHRGGPFDVTLTGRERENRSGNIGDRSSFYIREYVCPCGHRGWSNHKDLDAAKRRQGFISS